MINFRYPPYGEAMIELSSDELYELERLFNENPTLFRSFSYAWGLARSSSLGDLHKALDIFEDISTKQDASLRVKDIGYYKALVYYKLKEYAKAKRCLSEFLAESEYVDDEQIHEFEEELSGKIRSDGLKGVWFTGVAAVIGTVLLSVLFRKR